MANNQQTVFNFLAHANKYVWYDLVFVGVAIKCMSKNTSINLVYSAVVFEERFGIPNLNQKHTKLVSMFTGAVAALRAAGRASRAIYSKNFLRDKGSIAEKESISGNGSISDKESISYIISPKNRACA